MPGDQGSLFTFESVEGLACNLSLLGGQAQKREAPPNTSAPFPAAQSRSTC